MTRVYKVVERIGKGKSENNKSCHTKYRTNKSLSAAKILILSLRREPPQWTCHLWSQETKSRQLEN